MREPDENEYLNALIDIGLNLREARIYLSLLTRNNFTATEIAESAELSRPAAYELLNKMMQLGICKEKPGKVKRFQAIPPGTALPRLIEHQAEQFNRELKQKQSLLASLRPVLENLYEQSRGQVDPLDYFEALRDKRQIISRFLELQRQAKTEVLNFTKPPFALSMEDNIEEEDSIRRGVAVRVIYQYEEITPGNLEYIERISKIGEQARIIRYLPLKLAVFDSQVSLLAINDPITGKVSLTTLYINHKDFALLLKEAFESYWAKAIPFQKFKKDRSLLR
jgi:HTH-type transcriptional regulator, sugar sensing transcriptional regulator